MRTLIVGAGALGGTIATRLRTSGIDVSLAVRNRETAELLKRSGLQLSGIGGPASVRSIDVDAATLEEYAAGDGFDLIVLAAKAQDAIEVAPRAIRLLRKGATLLPLQNGGVSQLLAERFGHDVVLGGLSNLGATMVARGVYEQRNAGHLVIGEIAGGQSRRAGLVRDWLGRGLDVRITGNLGGAIWSKLLLNCSVTTIGAVAGCTMTEYIALPGGRELFLRVYDETLRVALATGATPERMIVDPIPPGWDAATAAASDAYDCWLAEIVRAYGGAKPSMLQDIERGRPTEIDFINGYVVSRGRQVGVDTPANAGIVETVRAITRREIAPSATLLERLAAPHLRSG
jgi:2-dehydropantoate 2-reductase